MKKSLISVLEVKKLRKDEVISKDEYYEKIVNIFIKSLDFKFSEVIGRGEFSRVLRVWNEKVESGFAMKIVLNEDVGPKEKEWGQLHHENILPLLDTESFPVFDLTWYLSPVVGLTLEDVLQKKTLGKNYMVSKFAISCMKQVALALNYMHKKELSFLNMKLSNVMICKDNKIKLFGFHRLCKISEFTIEYDVPDIFRPPESFSADCRKLPVEGKTFDLWCLGVLSIEVFTGSYLTRSMPDEVCCWSDIIYPQMFKILKKNKFNKECRFAFLNCNLGKNTLKLMKNFSSSCLRISPESRPSAEILLYHELFENTGLLSEKDKVWKKELKAEDMRQKIKNMNFLLDSIEPVTRNAHIQTDSEFTKSDNIDDEDCNDSREENAVLERGGNEISAEQTLRIDGENFGGDNEMLPYQISPSVKTESADNLFLLRDMFGRIVVDHCQENLTCRLLHREIVVKTIRNIIECKGKNEAEAVNSEIDNAVKFMQSSSRMSCLGYKIASKMFQYFI